MRSLNGLLIATSRGCTILVIPPGITAGSVFRDLSVLRIGADKWALNESQTSIDFFLDFGLQFCGKKCGLYMDVYGIQEYNPGAGMSRRYDLVFYC